MSDRTRIEAGFPEAQRDRVARLYWQAFSGKLGLVLGPEARALDFLTPALRPSHAFCALDDDGRVIGVAGFSSDDDTFVAGDAEGLRRVYGRFGMAWRGVLLEVLERPRDPGLLVMDGIFVSEAARGRGVGSALLETICTEARRRGKRGVRLDVIDTNPRARALYERQGFAPGETQPTGLFRPVFGFREATAMIRPV